ncbi:alanine racemase [Staphylococcus sp. SQ8-PEA]|uniref:Alanine racemase n=1 Tax=Staphylococcus marylandisciuri TaxID=2981529 RepID=A0ABT2QRG2_9STAP|nr:alanine racemase [Staphylococcus marylandisciuri]MCU5746543.1 alanine racemase [Staphylococcus marylandisciuri]
MSERYYRSSLISVDLPAIAKNYQVFGKLHPNKTIIPVVKANAYGLGSVHVARYLMEQGVEFFAVATLDEAVELRMHGVSAKIIVLGVIPHENVQKAIQHRVAMTVPSKEWLMHALNHIDTNNEKDIWLHIKIDSGMNRLGIKDQEEYQQTIQLIEDSSHLIFEGVYTHFACADEPGDAIEQQQTHFETVVNTAEKPQYIHSQNSAGSLRADYPFCNAIRIGISLYGYYPSEYIANNVSARLQPSVKWLSEVVETKYIEPGEAVSYGWEFKAERKMKIAILPIGYADGFLRSMSGFKVAIGNHNCPIIGRVCMDQTIIEIPDHIEVGDEVILMDNHMSSNQSAEAVARQQHTINYEVLCNLSRRLPRLYNNGDGTVITNELLK